mmetsp:Transcript_12578/g.29159  ORF Transcript_12578/g.29159 Transcript_12578/m.29159 type:complete len:177 (-) Transcript_12578:194-724(-)|eukprot:CAMPEP_0116830874 /NCGR_PEP_ID=MMETSP0418-20121206/5011_1 /TAXON_ID=1158023 /ORGANISM="Astrosyne radiata, Strain 13vi08-1A" /LENGTH=176 /DNA_ID=CAMNT_0004460037 /DNA_START=1 /DNA_END=531 /DNA_ORIENTATION=+
MKGAAAVAIIGVSSVGAFVPATFGARKTVITKMSDFDLDYGRNNDYGVNDIMQGTFGARSPNDWQVPGTSPIGEVSYEGANDGGDMPWTSFFQATVFLDLETAEGSLRAFTKEAADFKLDGFISTNPAGYTTKDDAFDTLVGAMGYDKFLQANDRELKKAWEGVKGKPEKKAKASE